MSNLDPTRPVTPSLSKARSVLLPCHWRCLSQATTANASSTTLPRPRQSLASFQNAAIPPLTVSTQPQLLPDVSLEVKIGQMLLLGFRGTSVDDNSLIARNIRDQHIGNIVLFSPNIVSPEQLKSLTARLQGLAQLPLLISVDQEGGLVARLSERRGFRIDGLCCQHGRRE